MHKHIQNMSLCGQPRNGRMVNIHNADASPKFQILYFKDLRIILQKWLVTGPLAGEDGVTTCKISSGTNCCRFTRYCVWSTPTDESCSRWFDSASLVALSISEIEKTPIITARLFTLSYLIMLNVFVSSAEKEDPKRLLSM